MHLHVLAFIFLTKNILIHFYSCVACANNYPLMSDIPKSLDLKPSSSGRALGLKTPDDMKKILSQLDKRMSDLKDDILSINTKHAGQIKGM